MNEDFVSFDLGMKLKEKGFREKVNAYYGKRENLFDVHPALDMNDSEYRCSAPTISQVLKWLREEKKRFVVIHPTGHVVHYYYTVHNLARSFDTFEYTRSFATYEEAAIAGIEYVIDNLI
jgi:hypothetical protein